MTTEELNALFESLRVEIDRLTAENTGLRSAATTGDAQKDAQISTLSQRVAYLESLIAESGLQAQLADATAKLLAIDAVQHPVS